MVQGSDQGSSGAGQHASWPSGGDAEADSPVAPAAAGAAAAMTLGSVLTVGGILLLFVVFALGLAILQYCFDARSRDRDDSRSGRRRRGPRPAADGGTRPRTTRGVDPELLRSLPVTVYRAAAPPVGSKHDADDAAAEVECAVCLAELQDGEEARFLPRCGHGFHADCVDTWLASHTTCPLCRLTVAKPDDGVVSPPAAAPSSLALPPVAPEPANYAAGAGASLPASVLLGVSDHGAVTAVTATTDVTHPNPSARPAAAMVIEIPEFAVPTLTTPCDAAKSPGSARLRSIRRLLSFGRQGTGGATSSCSCAGAGASDGVDLEKGIS